jgi:hypothetical protein
MGFQAVYSRTAGPQLHGSTAVGSSNPAERIQILLQHPDPDLSDEGMASMLS